MAAKKAIALIIIIALSLLLVQGAFATTYYVSNVGDSSAPTSGIETAAYQSVQYALSIANSGDTIYVFSGNYTIGELRFDTAQVSLIGADSQSTVLSGSVYVAADSVLIQKVKIQTDADTAVLLTADESIIYNSMIDGAKIGIYVKDSSNDTLAGLVFSAIDSYAVYVENSYNISLLNNQLAGGGLYIIGAPASQYRHRIEGNWLNGKKVYYLENVIDTVVYADNLAQVILVEDTSVKVLNSGAPIIAAYSFDISVESAVIENVPTGVEMRYSDSVAVRWSKIFSAGMGMKGYNLTRAAFYRNIFYNCDTGAALDSASYVWVYNNDFVNGGAGVYIKAGQNDTIINNIFYGLNVGISINGTGILNDFNCFYNCGTEVSGASTGSQSIVQDPKFIEAADTSSSSFLSLSYASPCRDRGDTRIDSPISWDPRVDIGAKEYINNAPNIVFAPDTIAYLYGTMKLDASSSYDPDYDTLYFSWSQLSGPPVSLNNASESVASFYVSDTGTYQFQLVINDGVLYDTDVLTIVTDTYTGPIWYVAVGGSDTAGNGSEYAPFASISHALLQADYGDTVFIMAGTYNIGSVIVINGSDSGVSIIGASAENTILDRNNIGYDGLVFHLKNTQDVIIKNLTITDAFAGIYAETVTNSVFANNIIYGCHNDGIFLGFSSGNEVHGNTIYNNGGFGIYLSDATGNTITYNRIFQNYIGMVLYAATHNNYISQNTIYNNSFDGIQLSNSYLNVVETNTIYANSSNGIYSYLSDTNTYRFNVLHSNAKNGIYVKQSSTDNISYDTIYKNSEAGIFLEEATGCTIAHNVGWGNNYGLLLIEGTELSSYSSHSIWANTTDSGAVYVYTNLDNTTLSGDSASTLLIFNSSNLVIQDYLIYEGTIELINCYNVTVDSTVFSKSAGIILFSDTSVRIRNNEFLNSKYGIYSIATDSMTVHRNLILSQEKGVYADAFDTLYIVNNTISSSNYGIYLESGSEFYFKSSIILNSAYGIYNLATLAQKEVAYSDFYSNTTDLYGIVADSGVIYANPSFVSTVYGDTGFYELSSASPCRDAGDPNTPVASGWKNRVDMGWKEYINQAPIARVVADTFVPAGETVTLDGTLTEDADGDSLTYQWTQIQGVSITIYDSTSATAYIVPIYADTYGIRFVVSDGEFSDTVVVYITATLSIQGTLKHGSIGRDGYKVFLLRGTEIYADTITAGGGLFSFYNVPYGDYEVLIPYDSDTESITPDSAVFVGLNTSQNVDFFYNHKPDIKIIVDTMQYSLSTVNVDASQTSDNVDNDALAFRWEQVSGESVPITGSNANQMSFVPVVYDTYVFRLYVSDGYDTLSETVAIHFINEAPQAQVSNSVLYAAAGDTVLLSAAASTDVNGDTLYFDWEQILGDTVTIYNANESVAYVIPASIDTYIFVVKVSDGDKVDTAQITVITTGKIEGKILYHKGDNFTVAGVENVQVSLAGSVQSNYVTSSDGAFSFSGIPRGHYEVSFARSGWYLLPPKVVIDTFTEDTYISVVATQYPQIDVATTLTLNYNETHAIDASKTRDPDNDTFSMNWKQIGGDTLILNGAEDSVALIYFTKIDTYYLLLTVTDSYGATSYETVVIYGRDLTPPQNCSVSINSGQEYTNSLRVVLSLHAEDTPVTMEISDTPDFSVHKLVENYSERYDFIFSDTDQGIKTVYVRFYDEYGNMSDAVSDTIIYDITKPVVVLDTGLSVVRDTFLATVYLYSDDIESVYLMLNDEQVAGRAVNDGETFVSFYVNSNVYADGSYTIMSKAYDFAGNYIYSNYYRLEIDNTAPSCSIMSPDDGDTVGGNSVELLLSSSDTDISSVVGYYSRYGIGADSPVQFYSADSFPKSGRVEIDLSGIASGSVIYVWINLGDSVGNQRIEADTLRLIVDEAHSIYGRRTFNLVYGQDNDFNIANGIRLYVPKYAVPQSDVISLSWEKVQPATSSDAPSVYTPLIGNGGSSYLLVTISASKISSFDGYAQLEVPIINVDQGISGYRLFYYDEEHSEWVKLSNSWPVKESSKVKGLIKTFGSYAPQASNVQPDVTYNAEKAYNYPNPAHSEYTTFRLYSLGDGVAKIYIYDISLDLIKTITLDVFKNAFTQYELSLGDITSGLYYYLVEFKYDDGTTKFLKGKMMVAK